MKQVPSARSWRYSITSPLAIVVVGMVVYRVIWFLGREKRRNSGVVWFKPRRPK